MNRRPAWITIGLYSAAVALALLAVGPAVWLVGVAVSQPTVPLSRLPMPSETTADNFAQAWKAGSLFRPFVNSLLVTVIQTVLNMVLAAAAAFPLARMSFPGRDVVLVLILATIMVPEQVLVVPLFRTVVHLGLYDTLAAVIVPFAVSALGVYLCRQAFMSVPKELEEAAVIDGAGPFRVWWHVMLPLIRPTLATLAAFTVLGTWSALLWPLIVLQDKANYTLPVALNGLSGMFASNIRYAYAGAVLALIPVVIFYIFMQKWLQRGIMAGAVKG
jgi:putative chitobiose transport system permease protein